MKILSKKNLNKKIFLFLHIFIMICVAMIFSACSSKNKTVKTGVEAESREKETYEYHVGSGRVSDIYIKTTEVPSRENYVNASVKIVDKSGKCAELCDENIGIRVRGHTTAHGLKVPYNIKFKEKTNVLGMGNSKKWCLIANMFDPTLMRNMLAFDFARDIGIKYVAKCQCVNLYFNNLYQGVYLMSMPVSEGKDKVDLDLSEGDYLLQLQPNLTYSDKTKITTKVGLNLSIEDGNEDDLTYLNDFMNKFEDAIAYGFNSFSEYADVSSFVDFYVFNELIKDVDFATSSTYFYIKDNKIYAGPVWDYDLSMGNTDSNYYKEYNNFSTNEENYKGIYCEELWFMYLLEIPEFKERVIKRFTELQPVIENLTTDNELGKNKIDLILETYGMDFKENFTVWEEGKKYGPNEMRPYPTYEENVEFLRKWIINRNEWLKNEWQIVEEAVQGE